MQPKETKNGYRRHTSAASAGPSKQHRGSCKDWTIKADESTKVLLTTLLASMDRQERNYEARMNRQEQQMSTINMEHRNQYPEKDQQHTSGDNTDMNGSRREKGGPRAL